MKGNLFLSTTALNHTDWGHLYLKSQFIANQVMFKRPKLYDYSDPQKTWKITYYVTSIKKNKLIRREIVCPKKFKTRAAKENWAADTMFSINADFDEGKYLYDDRDPIKPIETKVATFENAIEEAVEDKKNLTDLPKSKWTYDYHKEIIFAWAKENDFMQRPITDFGKVETYSMVRSINKKVLDNNKKDKKPISNRTYNNRLIYFNAIFNAVVKIGYLEKHYFDTVDKKRAIIAANTPFKPLEKVKVLKAVEGTGDIIHLWYVKFMYYSCCRPTELTRLKVEHLLDTQVLVPGASHKNAKYSYKVITEGLRQLLEEMKIREYPKNSYIFGRDGIGTFRKMSSTYITRLHTPILRGLGFPKKMTLYSWRDTAACDLLKATKDLEFVSRQLGHKNVIITMTYLRSMGELSDDENAIKAPILPI